MTTKSSSAHKLRVGIVVPHIFMQRTILPEVIFSPASLAVSLAEGLTSTGTDVTFFSPGPVDISCRNITADLEYFRAELVRRGDTYLSLLKKHPFTFISLARQVQSELIAKAYAMANNDELDVVHIYTNEEDTALHFAKLCTKPVLFTHHDPFNFMVKYKSVFPKYPELNWVSMSFAQRKGMPEDTNWVGNVYHGLHETALQHALHPTSDYIAYLGRIVEPKGVHVAIAAIKIYNQSFPDKPKRLKIAGKHYAGHSKDSYWQSQILPHIDNRTIEYVGFIDNPNDKQDFLANAEALLVPSIFEEPFGMVTIEALACGTPVIGLDSGAIPEVIGDTKAGIVIPKAQSLSGKLDVKQTATNLAKAIEYISAVDRKICRQVYEQKFTVERMCSQYLAIYRNLTQ